MTRTALHVNARPVAVYQLPVQFITCIQGKSHNSLERINLSFHLLLQSRLALRAARGIDADAPTWDNVP